MRASLTNLAAAALLAAACWPLAGAADAAGWRPSGPTHIFVVDKHGRRHGAFEAARRRSDRNGANFGDQTAPADATEIVTAPPPDQVEEQAAFAPSECPPAAAAVASGPRIIEIGASGAPRGPWPLVVYGDFTP